MAASNPSYGPRAWTFYVLATLFALFVIFLYGPMIAVLVLSFQGPSASLVFPLRDPSFMWFDELFSPRRTGDVVGAFSRSLPLAVMVMILTVLISVTAGFAFRRRFRGSTAIFYTAIASLIVVGSLPAPRGRSRASGAGATEESTLRRRPLIARPDVLGSLRGTQRDPHGSWMA